MMLRKKTYKKIVFALSIFMLLIWTVLGAGASLAWFADTTPEIQNIFHCAEFELKVSHRLEDGSYDPVDSQTKLFDENALYEPGYVQVVYLKIENAGTMPFDLKTAVSITDYTVATNVLGQPFHLQDYLTFGLVTADTEAALQAKLPNRDSAKSFAQTPLSNYSTEIVDFAAGQTVYMALIVHMPEYVDNVPNYRGTVIPRVELGLIISAAQQHG